MNQPDDTIHLAGDCSWRDVNDIHRLLFPLPRRILTHSVVLLLVALIVAGLGLPTPSGPLVFASCAAAYFVFLARAKRRGFARRQAEGTQRIELNDACVVATAGEQSTSLGWSAFGGAVRDSRFIVLRGRGPGGLPMVVLPKSWCASEEEWTRVEGLVARRLPKKGGFTAAGARRFREGRLTAERDLMHSVLVVLAGSLVVCLVAFVVPFAERSKEAFWYVTMFRALAAVAALTCAVTAWGVHRLAAWSSYPLRGLATLCFPFFPPGTYFGARIFRLLTTGPEPRLLSKEYEQLVRMTGPMRLAPGRRIRPFTWFVLAMILLIVILASLISRIPEAIRHNL